MSLNTCFATPQHAESARNGSDGGRTDIGEHDGTAGASSEPSALARLRAKSAQRAAARAQIADAAERARQYARDQDAAMDEYLQICAATASPSPSDPARHIETQLLAGTVRFGGTQPPRDERLSTFARSVLSWPGVALDEADEDEGLE